MKSEKTNKEKLSLILLNWKRTNELKKIVKEYHKYDLVGEIIIWNNNPDIHLELNYEKTRIINSSEDFGLFTRFAAASLSKYPCILYHDDDIIAPYETIKTLFYNWNNKPNICHSAFGRNPKGGKYSMDTRFGPVEIMLTRFVMVHRSICVHALSKTPKFTDIPGKPEGNGEDIILSYAAIDLSGKLNRAYELETKDLIQDDEYAINKRFPEHIAHRTKIIKRCRQVFYLPFYLRMWNWMYHKTLQVKTVINRELKTN